MVLTDQDKREFAERGYIVVPAVLSRHEIAAAMAVIDDLIAEAPPPDGHRGHHFYWPALEPGHPLLDLLRDGATFDVAEELIRPGRLEVPRQAQVALNIPPHPHRPGRGHIDGATPPEPDGRTRDLHDAGRPTPDRPDGRDVWLEFDAIRAALEAA